MTHSKLYKYIGHLHYTFNLYDFHEKTLEFEILWGSPLTDKDLRKMVVQNYQGVLGLSQKIGDMIVEKVVVILMEDE